MKLADVSQGEQLAGQLQHTTANIVSSTTRTV